MYGRRPEAGRWRRSGTGRALTGPGERPTMSTTWLGRRLALDRQTLALGVGDAAAIALFVALGELRHGGSLAAGVETFAQFGAGWVLAGVAAGVYAADALAGPRRASVRGVAAWVVAALVAQLLRLLVTPGSLVQPSFVLVSIGFGGLFIGTWRYVAARTIGGTDAGNPPA